MRFLICTDVAARGIDVQGIPFGEYLRNVNSVCGGGGGET